MGQKYAFFLDFDGTLVDHTHLPEENIRAIERARAEGHPVFLNTGRSPAFIPKWIYDKVTFDGILGGSGAYISIGDEVIQKLVIPAEVVAKNCRFMQKTGRQCIFEGIDKVLVLSPESETSYVTILDDRDFLENHADCGVEKLNIRGKLTFAEKRYISMFYKVIQFDEYAECSIPSVSKGAALEKVMERYPGYQSVAIGDSANDLDMLAVADYSVAMGNAPESVRHVCTDETDTVNNAGVAKAIVGFLDGTL
ncbi:MAG: HAD-IIB family hydrolase [Eubacteriales bacterium]